MGKSSRISFAFSSCTYLDGYLRTAFFSIRDRLVRFLRPNLATYNMDLARPVALHCVTNATRVPGHDTLTPLPGSSEDANMSALVHFVRSGHVETSHFSFIFCRVVRDGSV